MRNIDDCLNSLETAWEDMQMAAVSAEGCGGEEVPSKTYNRALVLCDQILTEASLIPGYLR